jgi:hypothetical protein
MRNLRFGPGFAGFVLFFGVAMLDAFRSQDWARAGFWVLIGIVFVWMDQPRRGRADS